MKKSKIVLFFLFIGVFSASAVAQTPQLLKRTTTKTEKFDFASGGTVAITGAPDGSIRVKGSNKNEIEITAEIEVQAANEADLALLANVTGFVVDERLGRTSIITIGTHNKLADKKLWKKFPQKLAALPFRVDYTVSIPLYSNLEIDGGKGDVSISNIEGAIKIKLVDTNARIESNGDLDAIIGTGDVAQFTEAGRLEDFRRLTTLHGYVRGYPDCFGHGLVIEGALGAMFDPALFHVVLNAPAGLTVATTGVEVHRTEEGDQSTTVAVAGPARDFAIALVPNASVTEAEVNGTTIRVVHPAGDPLLGAGLLVGAGEVEAVSRLAIVHRDQSVDDGDTPGDGRLHVAAGPDRKVGVILRPVVCEIVVDQVLELFLCQTFAFYE